ncbi:MAG: ABC transporter ATP-binding protein/permease [Clostridiales bacterium]|nr:ABC transporter ATP-binding protein/permease [Clostridiales bacterium]
MILYNVGVAVTVVELKFLEYATDHVVALIAGQEKAYPLIVGSLIFLAALLLLAVLNSVYFRITVRYNDMVKASVKERLTEKLSRIPYEYFERQETYAKIDIARQAADKYTDAVYGAMNIIRTAIFLVVYFVMLTGIGFMLTLALIASVVICTIFTGRLSGVTLRFWEKNVQPRSRRTNYFKWTLSSRVHQQNIQTQGSYKYFVNRFTDSNDAECAKCVQLNTYTEGAELLGNVLFAVVFFAAAFLLGNKAVGGVCTLGYFAMAVALLGNMFDQLKSFTLFLMNQNEFIRIVSDYFEIVTDWPDQDGPQENMGQAADGLAICAENLRYQYPQAETMALQGVDLSMRKGEKIAIVGENGSGKTTLMSVVIGLLSSYEGICQTGIQDCSALLQDFLEYPLTIRENIELGCGGKSLPEERLWEILRQVGLSDYVKSLKNGPETCLGQLDDGMELSKGQWQRLAVGRLLANEDADLWILDEPAAYLDPLAEIDIYQLIFDLAGSRTVIFTSHRLGFARMADRILVMDRGRVAEEGTHEELMRMNGIYKHMFEIQRKWYR